ncbi:MAG: hypothetical protein WBX15_06475, partial [Thermoanaerobaculia bacterium]
MNRAQRSGLLIGISLLLCVAFTAKGADFYELRLASGKEAYHAGRFADAAEQLRVAVFGFLDRPLLLSEGLARLVLAEESAGNHAAVQEELTRLLDAERRYGNWSRIPLEPPLRQRLTTLLLRDVPPETLGAIPSLASIAPETPGAPRARRKRAPPKA